jgi:hypothetical protein
MTRAVSPSPACGGGLGWGLGIAGLHDVSRTPIPTFLRKRGKE